MNVIVQPIIWIPALGFIIATLAFLGSFQSRGLTRGILILVALTFVLVPGYLLAGVFAPNLIDSRIRAYWAFYDAIEVGMTREQVLDTLESHYPSGGKRNRPAIIKDSENDLGFFMNPEEHREPNCEGIFLRFAEGKVTRKSYSRD